MANNNFYVSCPHCDGEIRFDSLDEFESCELYLDDDPDLGRVLCPECHQVLSDDEIIALTREADEIYADSILAWETPIERISRHERYIKWLEENNPNIP